MRWLGTSLFVLALAWFGLMGPGGVVGEAMAALAGTPAPAFDLVTLGGEAYSKESLKGQPTLLVF